jgi:hypothetical protein
MRRTATSWAICLRMLCAVALVFIGLSYKPVSAAVSTIPDLAAYTLPDGTMPDLCLNDMVDGKEKHVAGTGCEACRIGNAMLLPVPSDLVGVVLPYRFVAALPLVEAVASRAYERPGAPPRAPPVLPV